MENEKVVETKSCKHCNCSFEITDKDLEFYEKVSPVFAGKNYIIPTPTLCPDCRQQRRLSFRNERKLYKRKCDFSGKGIISIYSPDKKYKVYDQEIWWSDKWDPMDYGRDFDFSRGFFEQFDELVKEVPKRALVRGTGCENCEYATGIGGSKSCYLVFETSNAKNCCYGKSMNFSENCVDCANITDCIGCYEIIDCKNCYNCYFSQNTINSKNSYYLYNCKNCDNCFCCANLENAGYCIFNKKYTKEEYFKKLEVFNKSGFFREFLEFKNKFPHINLTIINSENSIGNNIYNSQNVYLSYEVSDCSNVRYSSVVYGGSNGSFDTYVSINGSQIVLESGIINKNSSNIFYCFDCWNECYNIFYSTECKNIKNCFGCHGISNKSYCISNKQYTKEEYEILVPKIIEHVQKTGEWGEFFPSSISPFGYNETVANEYFPLDSRDVFEKHLYQDGKQIFKWSDYEAPFPKVEKIIKAEMLPENITDIPDDILNWAIECEITKKPFRIIKQELEFYRKHNLPIPKRHPDQRHLDRMALRNPRKLFDRKCDKCKIDMKTTYSPDRKEIVYCEDCYNKEVY